MEQRIENVVKEYQQRQQRRLTLERELHEHLQDQATRQQMREMLRQKESNYLRMKRTRQSQSRKHFKKIRKIGQGAYGEVSLVQSVAQPNASYYAMKRLRKSQIVKQNQVAHVIAEKDILAEADNEWIVKLYYSFQVRLLFLINTRRSFLVKHFSF